MERGICPIAESIMTDTIRRGNFGDSVINKGYILHYFSTGMREKVTYFYFRSEIWCHHRVPLPDFLQDAGIPAIREHKAEIGIFMFAWIFRNFWPKMAFLGANRESGDALLTPTELFLTFEVCYLCATFGKSRSRNAIVRVLTDRQTDRQTDGHMQRQRQTEFLICSMLYAIAMGQITNGQSNLTTGRIAAVHGRFTGMVAPDTCFLEPTRVQIPNDISIQPFWQGSLLWQTDRQTDHNNRPHLHT